MYPGYDLTMKPTSGCMLRAYPTRAMKTRGEVAFHTSFPALANCETFVPQQQTGAEYNGISREATTAPAQWKAEVAAGERFICAGTKVSRGAGSGVCGLRVKKIPANDRMRAHELQRRCKRLAELFLSPCGKGIVQGLHIKKAKRLARHIKPFGAVQRRLEGAPRAFKGASYPQPVGGLGDSFGMSVFFCIFSAAG